MHHSQPHPRERGGGGGEPHDRSRFSAAGLGPQPPAAISVLRATSAPSPPPSHSPSPPSTSPQQHTRNTRAATRGTSKHLLQQPNVSDAFEWPQQHSHWTGAPTVAPQSHRQLFAQPADRGAPVPPLYALLTPSPPPPHVAHSPTAPPPWPSTTLHPTQPQTVAWTGVQPQPREEKEDGAARRQVASMPPLATGFDTSQQQQQLLYLQQLWAQHNFLQQQLQQQQQQPYHPQQQLQHPQSFQPHSHRLSGRRPASSPFGTSSPRRSADPASSPRGSGPSQRSGHSSQVAAPSSTKQAAAAAFAVSVSQASSRTSKRSSLPAPLHAAAPADPRTNTGHYSRPDTSPHAAPIAVAPTAATNPQHQQQQHQYPRTAVIQSPQHRSSSYPYPPSLLQSSSDEETYSNSDAIYTRNGQAASHFPMPPSSRQRPSDDDEEDSETEHDRHCETGSLDLSSDSGDDAAAAAQSPSEGSGSASPLAGTWSRDDESFVEGLAASFGRGPSASIVQPAAMRTMSSMSSSRPVAAVVPAVINSRPGSSSNHNHNRSRSHSRRASDLQHRVAALLAQHQPQQQQQSPKHRPKSTSGDRPQGGSNFKPRIGSAPRDRLMLQQQQQRRPQSSGMLSPRASNAAAQEAAAIFASSAPAADAFPAPQTHVAAANVPLLPPARSLFLSTHSPFFRRLPDELWSEIMGGIDAACLLCVVARLNREASRAVRDPEWWRQVRLGDGFAARLLAQQVSSKNAATSGGSMDRLHPELSPLRSGPSASLPSRLLSLSARWTLLESLDLSGVGAALTDDFFLALTKNHGSTANRGSSNSGGSGEVGAARFWSRSLRSLSLARCTQVTDVTLAALAPCCLALQTLDLSALALVTDEGFAAFLARIDAAGAGPNRNAGRRHGGGSGCQLVQLKLNRCYGLGDAAMGALATHAPRLQDLDLTFCNRVTDAGLAALASLAGSREGDASAAPAATPGLRQLSLRWCRSITDAGVRSLFSSPNGVIGVGRTAVEPPCNVLSYLNVDHCTLLTDESLECIAVHATALKQLSMVFCNKLTPRGLHLLFHAPRPLPLRTLVFDHCDALSSVFASAGPMPLHFSSGSGCAAASRSLPALSVLSCRCCPHAGLERSRHAEIQAECCPGFVVLAPPSRTERREDAGPQGMRACMAPAQRDRFVAELARLSAAACEGEKPRQSNSAVVRQHHRAARSGSSRASAGEH